MVAVGGWFRCNCNIGNCSRATPSLKDDFTVRRLHHDNHHFSCIRSSHRSLRLPSVDHPISVVVNLFKIPSLLPSASTRPPRLSPSFTSNRPFHHSTTHLSSRTAHSFDKMLPKAMNMVLIGLFLLFIQPRSILAATYPAGSPTSCSASGLLPCGSGCFNTAVGEGCCSNAQSTCKWFSR